MVTGFKGKQITSMLGILPETSVSFDDEVSNYSFPPNQTMRLKKLMGYDHHRLAKETTTVSDLAVFGMRYILDNGWISADEIGVIITVSLCPDHFVPHIGNIVQGACGLGTDVISLDIAQGCCGYLVGLAQAFMMLDHTDKKVVLINGDILSHKVSRRDRNDFPLIGDGAAITIIENAASPDIYYEMHNDGSRADALKIPAGGFRMPSTPETAVMKDQGDGNFRALDNMHMNGSDVFTFVQTEVPPMITGALERTHRTLDSFDRFFFHQPNRFMLQKLADKIGIPYEKIPMDLVEHCGNPSGASIPLVAILNCREELLANNLECCLSAFGSGLAWGTMFIEIGPLKHCEIKEAPL